MSIVQNLKDGKSSICVVGLGYVGLPLALEFAKKFKVVGYDFKADRVELMKNSIDPSKEIDAAEFESDTQNISITLHHHSCQTFELTMSSNLVWVGGSPV